MNSRNISGISFYMCSVLCCFQSCSSGNSYQRTLIIIAWSLSRLDREAFNGFEFSSSMICRVHESFLFFGAFHLWRVLHETSETYMLLISTIKFSDTVNQRTIDLFNKQWTRLLYYSLSPRSVARQTKTWSSISKRGSTIFLALFCASIVFVWRWMTFVCNIYVHVLHLIL